MYEDVAPHLPRVVVFHPPAELAAFQQQLDSNEVLGFETETVVADILDHLHKEDEALFNLSLSGYEMMNSNDSDELATMVEEYVKLRDEFGKRLYQLLHQNGMYVNGTLYYQLRRLNNAMMVLEKLQIPLTDDQLRRRAIARQADLAGRRVVSAFDARSPFSRYEPR